MMEDSTMDMTGVCSTVDGTKSDNFFKEKDELHQENYELKNKVQVLERAFKELENEMLNVKMAGGGKPDLDLSASLDVNSSKVIFQENHELKKKIDVLEKINIELENDITHLTHMKAKETTKLVNVQEELELANSKRKYLESSLEEERREIQRLKQEGKEVKGIVSENKAVVVPDQEQLNLLTLQIEKLEIQREDDQQSMKTLLDEKAALVQTLNTLNSEKKVLQTELSELKEHLDQKTTDLRNVNTALEGLREDKLLLNTEIQLLKASDGNASRGNSLFAEVEENRQKVAAQRELLKLKYLNLKKIYNQKQNENNKLKLEIVKIRREKEDEKDVHYDYSNLIETYKQRVWELEERVKELEQKAGQPPVVVSDTANSQWLWVNTVVENARKETRNLQEELDRRGSNYVAQGHQLLASQRENRKLKTTISKLQSDIDELKLKFDAVKSVKENDQDQDGISPPTTEVVLEHQKQKMVRFRRPCVNKEPTQNTTSHLAIQTPH